MRNLYTLAVIFIFTGLLAQAQRVSGLVVDASNQPIAYATIQVADYGTISNAEGEFEVTVGELPDNTPAKISFIGYKTLNLSVGTLKATTKFVLEKDIMSLDEVFVTNKRYTPEELIQKVLERVDSNYLRNNFRRTVYGRNQSTVIPLEIGVDIEKSSLLTRNERKELNEEFEALSKRTNGRRSTSFQEVLSNYYKVKDSSAIARVIKATELKDEEKDVSAEKTSKKMVEMIARHLDSTHTYKVSTGLFTIDREARVGDGSFTIGGDDEDEEESNSAVESINSALSSVNLKNYNLDFLHKTKRYEYTLEDATSYNGKTVYVLRFEPDSRKADFIGKLFINADDFAVVKMDFKIAPNRDGEKLNLKFLLGIKFVEEDASYSVTFERTPDTGLYIPQLLLVENIMYAYLNRGFKFKRNKNNPEDEKLKLKFDILIETRIISKEEFYFLDYSPFTAAELSTIEKESKFQFERISRYDPSIWAEYNILPAIKELEEYSTD